MYMYTLFGHNSEEGASMMQEQKIDILTTAVEDRKEMVLVC